MYIFNYITQVKENVKLASNNDWIRINNKTYRTKLFFSNNVCDIVLNCSTNVEENIIYLEIINFEKTKCYYIEAPKEILLTYLSKNLQPTSETFNKFIYDNELY